MLDDTVRRALEHLEAGWCQAFLKGRVGARQAKTLVTEFLHQAICQTRLEGRQVLHALHKSGWIESSLGEVGLSPRLDLNPMVVLAAWRREELAAGLPAAHAELELTAVQTACWNRTLADSLEGFGRAEQQRLVTGLRDLAAELPEAYAHLTAFEASARYLLGSSKLLKALPRELVLSFGIDPEAFRRPKVRLLASMPTKPEGLLLIENPQSFDQACRLGLDLRLALVCSFGYGLSLGEALDEGSVSLIGEGPLPLGLEALLMLPSLTYWGDLDPEGLRIYQKLKRRLPSLRLSALYGPMLEAMERGTGHPLHRLTGKGGQRAAGKWARGLDQEWLDEEACLALAEQALDTDQETRVLERLLSR